MKARLDMQLDKRKDLVYLRQVEHPAPKPKKQGKMIYGERVSRPSHNRNSEVEAFLSNFTMT